MSLKQMLCIHMWETVECITALTAARNAAYEYDIDADCSYIIKASKYNANDMLYNKVCLKCEKCSTELTDFREEIKNYTDKQIKKINDAEEQECSDTASEARSVMHRKFQAKLIFDEYIRSNND